MAAYSQSSVPAVVVGAGINGLGVLRSLARAGVPVIIMDSKSNGPAMFSRYGRKLCYHDDAPDALITALEAVAAEYAPRRAVLLLTQEEAVKSVAVHRARLSDLYHLTLPATDILTPLLHKDSMGIIARSAGIRVPHALRIQTADDIAEIDALRLPLVIKPAVRDVGYTRAFSKAYRVNDHATARSLLQRILPILADVVVQEWIEGSDSDIYFCLQYLPVNGGPPASFVGRKLRSWPPQVGGTASCTSAPEAEELSATTTSFFRHAGFTGLAGMEYKRDVRSGDYFIVEPTVGRTDYQEEVATLNGVNIPLDAYCDALGLTRPKPRYARPVRVWRDRIADTQSAAQASVDDSRVPSGVRVVDAVWRKSDPMPALVPLAKRIGRRLRRAGRRAGVRRGNLPS